MFAVDLINKENQHVSVIGQFLRIQDNRVILKVGKCEVPVEHKGLENYQTKFVLVTGNVQNGEIIEESVHKVEDDFDMDTFLRLASLTPKYTSIF